MHLITCIIAQCIFEYTHFSIRVPYTQTSTNIFFIPSRFKSFRTDATWEKSDVKRPISSDVLIRLENYWKPCLCIDIYLNISTHGLDLIGLFPVAVQASKKLVIMILLKVMMKHLRITPLLFDSMKTDAPTYIWDPNFNIVIVYSFNHKTLH